MSQGFYLASYTLAFDNIKSLSRAFQTLSGAYQLSCQLGIKHAENRFFCITLHHQIILNVSVCNEN